MFEKIKTFINKNFHSMSHRNYRLFFIGQLVSLIGTWMQAMAQAWLVYEITNSPFKLGIVAALQFLPVLLFGLFMGVFVDKFHKKNILIITQTASMLQAFVLFGLAYFNVIEYWHILILSGLLGCTNALDMPARQAYVIELVGRKDVVNAIGLNSVVFNTARIVGPAIAGILMTSVGTAWCFLLNGMSFIGVIIALMMIRHTAEERAAVYQKKKVNLIKDIKEGLLYIYRTPLLFKTSLIILFITILGFNYNVLLPVFAKTVLGLREKGFGLLLSSLGIGSLIGALTVSVMGKSNPRGRTLIISSIFLGLLLFFLGLVSNRILAVVILALCGVFNIWFFTNANSILQLNSADEYRGRVMGVYAMVFGGTIPIGNFITGLIAEKTGAAFTFNIMGAVIFITVLLFLVIRGPLKQLTGNR
ncbi:MAG: MFS transporter [Proteobacteria bacterium]|nr:MFS transporter [Pseudomonadota bacterium]